MRSPSMLAPTTRKVAATVRGSVSAAVTGVAAPAVEGNLVVFPFSSGQVLAVEGGFDAAGVGLPTMRGR